MYGWGLDFAAVNNGGYGWFMGVDPADPDWTPRKHTNLGRLRHENATVWARDGKQLIVYTGDDARNRFLYKYVSAGSYHRARGRRNSRLLEDGQLWVAEFGPASQDETVLSGTGRWHRVEMSPATLVDPDTWVRAQPWFNPATRPHPAPGRGGPRPHRRHLRLVRHRRRGRGRGAGGRLLLARQPGLRPPRQPLDGHRHLLRALNDPASPYAYHRNNGIFMIRVGGPDAGVAFRFGSVPNEAESTGPIWTPDQTTMFLSIQHPGEETSVGGGVLGDPTTYTSWWPRGNKTTGEHSSEPCPR